VKEDYKNSTYNYYGKAELQIAGSGSAIRKTLDPDRNTGFGHLNDPSSPSPPPPQTKETGAAYPGYMRPASGVMVSPVRLRSRPYILQVDRAGHAVHMQAR
jgi:hypothetical protein